MAMDGTPVRTSAAKRTVPAIRPRRSTRKRAVTIPTGTAMAAARPTMITAPTMALEIPPPGIPAGMGTWVKKSTDRAWIPRDVVYATSATSGASEMATATTHSADRHPPRQMPPGQGPRRRGPDLRAPPGRRLPERRPGQPGHSCRLGHPGSGHGSRALLRVNPRAQQELAPDVDEGGEGEEHHHQADHLGALRARLVTPPKVLMMADPRVAPGCEQRVGDDEELFPMTMATAIDSPRARPMARVTAASMPVRAPGMTARRTTCQRVAPRARAASRSVVGHRGQRRPRQRHDGGQDHHGQDHPGQQHAGPVRPVRGRTIRGRGSSSGTARRAGRRPGSSTSSPHSPTTMLGTAAMRSIRTDSGPASQRGASSDRKAAVATPMGTARSDGHGRGDEGPHDETPRSGRRPGWRCRSPTTTGTTPNGRRPGWTEPRRLTTRATDTAAKTVAPRPPQPGVEPAAGTGPSPAQRLLDSGHRGSFGRRNLLERAGRGMSVRPISVSPGSGRPGSGRQGARPEGPGRRRSGLRTCPGCRRIDVVGHLALLFDRVYRKRRL